jgi:hypothetical protein
MNVILAATCIIIGGIVLFLFLLVVGTTRLVDELRDDVEYLRIRLKQLDARVLSRRERDGPRPGQKAPAFQLPRFIRARTPPRNEQGKSQSWARCRRWLK